MLALLALIAFAFAALTHAIGGHAGQYATWLIIAGGALLALAVLVPLPVPWRRP